jgi:hypothetical protein
MSASGRVVIPLTAAFGLLLTIYSQAGTRADYTFLETKAGAKEFITKCFQGTQYILLDNDPAEFRLLSRPPFLAMGSRWLILAGACNGG